MPLSQASSANAGKWVWNKEVTYTTTHLQGVKKEIRATNLLSPPTKTSAHDQRTLFLTPAFPSYHLNKSEKTGWDFAIPIILCNKSIATLTFPLQLYRNSFLLFPTNAVSPQLKLCFCLEHFSATDMQL